MTSKLTKEQQELVAQTLVDEFGETLGVNITGARISVANGSWDDHPVLSEAAI